MEFWFPYLAWAIAGYITGGLVWTIIRAKNVRRDNLAFTKQTDVITEQTEAITERTAILREGTRKMIEEQEKGIYRKIVPFDPINPSQPFEDVSDSVIIQPWELKVGYKFDFAGSPVEITHVGETSTQTRWIEFTFKDQMGTSHRIEMYHAWPHLTVSLPEETKYVPSEIVEE